MAATVAGQRPSAIFPIAVCLSGVLTSNHTYAVRRDILLQVLRGTADSSIRFDGLRSLLAALGFDERVKGSHHIFTRPGVAEILNLQPHGSLAKPYQVRQVRSVIVRYKLAEGSE